MTKYISIGVVVASVGGLVYNYSEKSKNQKTADLIDSVIIPNFVATHGYEYNQLPANASLAAKAAAGMIAAQKIASQRFLVTNALFIILLILGIIGIVKSA